MITFHRAPRARRHPAGYRVKAYGLRMIGHAAVWYHEQKEALDARPADATAPCACCDTVYRVEALKPLNSEWLYERVTQVVSLERDGLVCPHCREDFAVEFGDEPDDVYHILDRGHDRND